MHSLKQTESLERLNEERRDSNLANLSVAYNHMPSLDLPKAEDALNNTMTAKSERLDEFTS